MTNTPLQALHLGSSETRGRWIWSLPAWRSAIADIGNELCNIISRCCTIGHVCSGVVPVHYSMSPPVMLLAVQCVNEQICSIAQRNTSFTLDMCDPTGAIQCTVQGAVSNRLGTLRRGDVILLRKPTLFSPPSRPYKTYANIVSDNILHVFTNCDYDLHQPSRSCSLCRRQACGNSNQSTDSRYLRQEVVRLELRLADLSVAPLGQYPPAVQSIAHATAPPGSLTYIWWAGEYATPNQLAVTNTGSRSFDAVIDWSDVYEQAVIESTQLSNVATAGSTGNATPTIFTCSQQHHGENSSMLETANESSSHAAFAPSPVYEQQYVYESQLTEDDDIFGSANSDNSQLTLTTADHRDSTCNQQCDGESVTGATGRSPVVTLRRHIVEPPLSVVQNLRRVSPTTRLRAGVWITRSQPAESKSDNRQCTSSRRSRSPVA